MTLKIAVIGCGATGKRHARGWHERQEAEVVALFDADADACNTLAEELGATAYDTHEKAIDHEGVDAVSICTPTPFHRPIACYAAERGRHILTEKPMGASVEDCDAMVEAAERNGVWLTVGHQYRNWPRNMRIKELIDQGALGSPLIGRYQAVAEVRPKTAMNRKSMNQGPVLDMAAHWVDLMRHFTGCEPASVYGSGHVFGRGKPRLAALERDDDFAIDAAEVQVRFEGGHILSFGIIWGMPESFPGAMSEQITGPTGLVRNTGGQAQAIFGPDENQQETLPTDPGQPMPRIADLIEAIQTGKKPLVTGADGREAVRACRAALQSIETNQVIELTPQTA